MLYAASPFSEIVDVQIDFLFRNLGIRAEPYTDGRSVLTVQYIRLVQGFSP